MTKFDIHYRKIKKIVLEDLEKMHKESESTGSSIYHPFHISKLQCYNPIYKLFFEMNESNYDTIALNHKYHMYDLKHVISMDEKDNENNSPSQKKREIFIKFSPLLDPIRFLIGKYKEKKEVLTLLPSYNNTCNVKLANTNNASYIDNFFCYLSSQLLNHHAFPNAIDYYGSFLGIQEKYKFNAADDIDYLVQSEYFTQNRGKIYEIEESENPFANFGSRNNKNKLLIHNDSNISIISLEEVISLDVDNVLENINDITNITDVNEVNETTMCIYEKIDDHSDASSVNTSNNSECNYSDDEKITHDEGIHSENATEDSADGEEEDSADGEEEDSADDEEEDSADGEEEDYADGEEEDSADGEEDSADGEEEPKINAFIYDFPMQMICLEKCTGTLDDLFVLKQLDLDTVASALFQIIMTLLLYQKAFHFTHNDLHTNNVMYIETDQEFLIYKYGGVYYKVPTYGKIFKIIDYGRAIYKFKGKTFCSDSFAPGGDAHTQYNFEPYFNEKKARLDPNYSFDLCRLGCSIYDFILDIEDEQQKDFEPDELQRTIIRWISDDNGKNVLYMKNGDERYENFKLYKMIARTVHAHTPEAQLSDPFFNQFKIDEKLSNITPIDIDAIPCYC
jgi:hypothetical protein